MKKYISLLVLMVASFPIFAQGTAKLPNPDEQIKVNKEYDENGNLIRFDSTYTKSWSSDSTLMVGDIDSIYKDLERYFGLGADGVYTDSTLLGAKGFHDFNERFFQKHLNLMNQLGPEPSDSTLDSLFILKDHFGNFDQLRQEMMSRFKTFFEDDSLDNYLNGLMGNGNLTSPDEEDINQMRENLEKYFDQFNPKKPVK